jgi:putative FmdB family regulatory protein
MPTYQYKCVACNYEFEKEQRITDDPESNCSKCKKKTAKRQIAGSSFILAGSGWYRDGYSGKNR